MNLVNKLGISNSLANTIMWAIAIGNVGSWLLALVPGPGWIVKAAIATAEYIVEREGKLAAVAF